MNKIKAMETITKMALFAETLEKMNSVVVPKCRAKEFFIFCKMSDINVSFAMNDNKKIVFSLR